jgi:hypothetical protein
MVDNANEAMRAAEVAMKNATTEAMLRLLRNFSIGMRRQAATGSRGLNRKQSYGLGLLPSARRHAWSRTPSSYSAHSDQRYSSSQLPSLSSNCPIAIEQPRRQRIRGLEGR